MTDTLTQKERSERMSRIRGKDSACELRLRRLIHGMGYRYRLHVRSLPGTPDIVLTSRNAVIFMHGCFWHRHSGCPMGRMPKSNTNYWKAKFDATIRRDNKNENQLRELGWRVLVIWECEMKKTNLNDVSEIVQKFLTDQT